MTKINVLLASLFTIGLMASCSSNSKEDGNQMTMTVKTDKEISFYVAGIGDATIDWGDGSVIETVMLSGGEPTECNHDYSSKNEYVVTLTGDITTFQCSYLNSPQRLTALDLSKNAALTELFCIFSELTSLDVSKNTALTKLECRNNKLTTLDVSKNIALKELDCGTNQLTALDISNNVALESLNCINNRLTSLDVSKNKALTSLCFHKNQLTSIDVSHNTALTGLYGNDNKFTSLDISHNTALTDLCFDGNQLTNLDISNNTALEFVDCKNNQLSAAALNAMMTSLNNNDTGDYHPFFMGYNPGTDDCNRNIAREKGWTVEEFYQE